MSNFYHIYISPKNGIIKDQIEKTMDFALDWFRHDDHVWVVYSTSDAKKWYARLEKFVKPGGYVFISQLDLNNYYGYMSKKFWAWIKKNKTKK